MLLTRPRLDGRPVSRQRCSRWIEIEQGPLCGPVPPSTPRTPAPNRVPRLAPALEVLEAAKRLPDSSGHVFRSANERELSNATMGKLPCESGFGGVLHGFREWCGELRRVTTGDRQAFAVLVSSVKGERRLTDPRALLARP